MQHRVLILWARFIDTRPDLWFEDVAGNDDD